MTVRCCHVEFKGLCLIRDSFLNRFTKCRPFIILGSLVLFYLRPFPCKCLSIYLYELWYAQIPHQDRLYDDDFSLLSEAVDTIGYYQKTIQDLANHSATVPYKTIQNFFFFLDIVAFIDS